MYIIGSASGSSSVAERQLPKVDSSFIFNNLDRSRLNKNHLKQSRTIFTVVLRMVFDQYPCGFRAFDTNTILNTTAILTDTRTDTKADTLPRYR